MTILGDLFLPPSIKFQFEHRTPEMVTIRCVIDRLQLELQSSLIRYVNWKC